jgi:hypothetical protein
MTIYKLMWGDVFPTCGDFVWGFKEDGMID